MCINESSIDCCFINLNVAETNPIVNLAPEFYCDPTFRYLALYLNQTMSSSKSKVSKASKSTASKIVATSQTSRFHVDTLVTLSKEVMRRSHVKNRRN